MKYYIKNTRELMIEKLLLEMEERGEALPESTKVDQKEED